MDDNLVVGMTWGGAATKSVTLTTGYKKCEITMINYGGSASLTLLWNGGPAGAATMGALPWQLVLPVGGPGVRVSGFVGRGCCTRRVNF
jgi:hypothetical protein